MRILIGTAAQEGLDDQQKDFNLFKTVVKKHLKSIAFEVLDDEQPGIAAILASFHVTFESILKVQQELGASANSLGISTHKGHVVLEYHLE